MNRSVVIAASALVLLCLGTPPALATQWVFDPAVLIADGRALLLRAPDHDMDQLFQAVHAAAQLPDEAAALCTAFDPDGELGLEALQSAGEQFGDASRERFVTAITTVMVAATRHPPQPFDEAQAQRALRAAGVAAAIQHDGFTSGLNGVDPEARCRSVRQLIDALQARPLAERAAATRLLLREGLTLAAPALQR
ncbi:MAG: hypothetical protein M3Q42_14720 [Pseudomonadota bacterium]|nr:hypothetical protein [Pseudomonadota bacterium]